MINVSRLAANEHARREAEMERELARAAVRTLEAGTRMLRASPRDKITIECIGERFAVTIETSTAKVTFNGGDIQDALSQAMNAFVCDEATDKTTL